MAFLEPGETYELPLQNGSVTCKALSFREQRSVIKDIKKLQSNNDPEEAMDLVEKVIAASLVRWAWKDQLGDSAAELLGMITFPEAMDLGKRITDGGKLSSDERKK